MLIFFAKYVVVFVMDESVSKTAYCVNILALLQCYCSSDMLAKSPAHSLNHSLTHPLN